MKRILLLRGVNVGGVKLPMAGFRDMLAGLGLGAVQTYIQSGDAVFDDPGIDGLAGQVSQGLQTGFGIAPEVFLYTPPEFAAIADECPYANEGFADGTKVHVFYLMRPCGFVADDFAEWVTVERLHITERAIHLHAPDGVGRSKLAEMIGRRVKVPMTARNWNTVQALLGMA